MNADFTIVGAGVVGLCVATELAARGADIEIVDRHGGPGAHGCSWWAGGMLAADCEGEQAEEPVVRLGGKAADWWAAQGVPVWRNGSIVVALGRDRQELDRFARRTENHSWLGAEQLSETEPYLAERFDRALFMQREAHIDPRKALQRLEDNLKQQGVVVHTKSKSNGKIIDCRGLAARDVLSDLRGVKGEMVILRAPDIAMSRPVRLLHPRFPLYIVPRGDGVFMLGATQIESEARDHASVRSVMELLNASYALHPAFAEAELLEIGVDARPAFPDNLPRIPELPDRIAVNGLFRHGYLLAPALAQMTADYLLSGKRPEFWSAA